MIHIECGCGKSMDVPDHFAGKRGKCKHCGAALTVPAVASAPAPVREIVITPTVVPRVEPEPVYGPPVAYVPPPPPATVVTTVPCPFCHEPIQAAAKKCRHCGEFLDPVLRAASVVHVPPATPSPTHINVHNVLSSSSESGASARSSIKAQHPWYEPHGCGCWALIIFVLFVILSIIVAPR